MRKATKKQTPSKPVEQSKSEALKNYESNLDQIMAFVDQLRSARIGRVAMGTVKALKKEVTAVPKADVKKLERIVENYKAAADNYMAFLLPACRWMSVMMVSFMETFLEDGLIEVAKRNPRIVKNVEVQTSRLFEVDTMDELRTEVRLQWAHDALRPGGPKTWYKTLRQLGAPVLDEATIDAVQHLWETRNLIVHSRCIASAAYAKKHAKYGIVAGTEVKVNLHTFGQWLVPVKHFVEWADTLFRNYGSKKGKPVLIRIDRK
jgi:hypothetical protein